MPLRGTTKDENNRFPFEGGTCEGIQFLLPSLVRRGLGGGGKSRWTNPLGSPLTKGDTCMAPELSFSQLREGNVHRGDPGHPQPRAAAPLKGGFSEDLP